MRASKFRWTSESHAALTNLWFQTGSAIALVSVPAADKCTLANDRYWTEEEYERQERVEIALQLVTTGFQKLGRRDKWFRPQSPSRRRCVSGRSLGARRAAIRWRSTIRFGRPSRLPLARAFRSPAFTRFTISDRSSSATAPKTVRTILPAGVEVSTDSDKETKISFKANAQIGFFGDDAFTRVDGAGGTACTVLPQVQFRVAA